VLQVISELFYDGRESILINFQLPFFLCHIILITLFVGRTFASNYFLFFFELRAFFM